MNYFFSVFILIGIYWPSTLSGQPNFRKDYKKADPVDKMTPFVLDERVGIHTEFLHEAIQANDSLKQLYGNFYLFYDYLRVSNFPEANRYLLEANKIADASGNISWQGWATYQKAIWLSSMRKDAEAIPQFEIAAKQCAEVGDSLCYAECIEQIGSLHSQEDEFEEAKRYFVRAIPLIEKFGGESQVSVTLNNFGIFLSRQGRPEEAIPYLKRAIAIMHKNGSHKKEGQAMNNLADAYRRLKQYDKSIEIYEQCLRHNQKFNQPSNLLSNYGGLTILYEEKGDLHAAFPYLVKYHAAYDSIMGAKTQLQIADLETKYETQKKEMALQKSQHKLEEVNRSLERRTWAMLLLLAVGSFGLWLWMTQRSRTKKELAQNYENLKQLTQVMLDKNALIGSLETQVSDLEKKDKKLPVSEDFEENLYNRRILTDSDWIAFKTYFEKTYPGYLLRLRKKWPSLSEAEERLFLFLKLNLTRKEAAAILGISVYSIKKTRNRLRKRLGLEEGQSLDKLIQSF